MEYDPAHKTSSVTSTSSSTSSIWDPLPSLYTGRADSVSSAYDFDDLQEPESFNDHSLHSIVLNEDNEQQQKSFNEFLNSFLEENQIKEEVIGHHELPPPDSLCNGKRPKRPYQEIEEQDKKNRDLLSDDQKRANHIASEQKRRNTIRGGFKELTEIIPTLKNINNSKSTILFKSVEYIKQMDKRNKALKERLAQLQQRVQQKTLKKHSNLPSSAIAALIAHKNQQKQLELLQEQLRVQQALLTKHNIQPHQSLYPFAHTASSKDGDYHSISIPAMIDTPTTSTATSPTLQHASLPLSTSLSSSVNNSISFSSPAALVMPSDEWQQQHLAPSFIIPADENYNQNHLSFRERLLSSGKLNHLRKISM
ncbi:hypothetical protein BD408DRAFT_389526 [Parasitella parasitica]|nr:hypothetical protein BD408DRAFT_389526 [Parasitella parasitica]